MSQRLDRTALLALFRDAPLGELMRLAHAERVRRWGAETVTYVRDTNPNYTNICETGCRFCAFHRAPGDPDGYLLSPDELVTRVIRARDLGASTVLLQGGANPQVRLHHWVAYLRAIQTACPTLHLHPFSPAEIAAMAAREGMPTRQVLGTLRELGISTLPGGGAEILSPRIHQQIAPRKCGPDDWLRIMEEAHGLGFRTTATMMFGHVEIDEDIVEHWLRLRQLQDRTGGFNAFVPWSFKPGRSPLGQEVPAPVHPARYIRILALARLALDNFPHIQSSWFSESPRAGQLGLLAGADDFGGILVEENVLKTAGHARQASEAEVCELIRAAGFTPAVRDSHYRRPPANG